MIKTSNALMIMASFFLLASCGGGDSEATEGDKKNEKTCPENSEINVIIENYGYRHDETYSFKGDFEVVRSEWVKTSDSTANLNLYNYDSNTAASDKNVAIKVSLFAKNGNKLKEGSYAYQDYQADYYASVIMQTSKGNVYFNWKSGMPDQGTVNVTNITDSEACGSFNLAVQDNASTQIGHVELKGNWTTK